MAVVVPPPVSKPEMEKLARELMNKHGLVEWRFKWMVTKRVGGECNRTRKLIRLSWPYAEINGARFVKHVMLHEIAHALTTGAHGAAWKTVARALGCEPKATMPHWVLSPRARWRVVCGICGWVAWKHRKTTARKSCPKCHPDSFDERYLLRYEEM